MAQQQGKQFPSLVDAPRLTLYEDFYFHAFHDLSASRSSNGFGAGPIMLTEIAAYADLHSIAHGEDRHQFVKCMRVLDAAYLHKINAKDSVSNG